MAVVERDFGANFIFVEVLGNEKVKQNMYVIWLDQEGSAAGFKKKDEHFP